MTNKIINRQQCMKAALKTNKELVHNHKLCYHKGWMQMPSMLNRNIDGMGHCAIVQILQCTPMLAR